MVQGYHEIHHTVLDRFGGSICGEHGDGRVRAEYVPAKMFGPELYELFVKVKRSFRSVRRAQPGRQDQRPALHGAYRLHQAIQILRDLRQV